MTRRTRSAARTVEVPAKPASTRRRATRGAEVAELHEAISHRCASAISAVEEHAAMAEARIERIAVWAQTLADRLDCLCTRAERLIEGTGFEGEEGGLPPHEAPVASTPGPRTGTLADLVARANCGIDRARPLVNDLARQMSAAQRVSAELAVMSRTLGEKIAQDQARTRLTLASTFPADGPDRLAA
ncbi:MAG: hypothetical protein KF745_07680 [Phycisphaeraceae bacterium]|nr:hypothetical protein [Phycisphaeraceae bacterium]